MGRRPLDVVLTVRKIRQNLEEGVEDKPSNCENMYWGLNTTVTELVSISISLFFKK